MSSNGDFFFPSTTALSLGSPAEKFQGNLEAIRIIKACQAEGRPATPEEQTALARYVGWGDSALLRRLRASDELRALLTEGEMKAALGSSLNAHYTALPVVGAIWEAIARLGLDGKARIVDPSAGVGHFKSCAPEGLRAAEWAEIELDTVTADILALLHPQSRVYAQGYETVNLPAGWFDLVISNVPFGDYGVAFKGLPAACRSAIHDFFFCHSVALLRPGGILAFVTSRFTLDKKDQTVRQWLAKRLDLLAAVRLPDNAFKANAGTEVVTDILILQRRATDRADDDTPAWARTGKLLVQKNAWSSQEVDVNRWYIEHPEMMLGIPSLEGTMYAGDQFTLRPNCSDLAASVEEAFSLLPEGIARRAESAAPEQGGASASGLVVITTAPAKALTPDQQARVDRLHEVYRAAKAVLAAETEGSSLFHTSELRHALNQVYDRFTAGYGAINRPENARLLAGTPEWPFLKALETWDGLSARKAGIFSGPLVRSASTRREAPTAGEALAICLDRKGEPLPGYIAHLMGVSEAEVIRQLGDMLFQAPDGRWLTADAYLSGNVREKLKQAEAAAAFNPGFRRNVDALRAALPEPLTPGEIRAPLGAGWIPTDMVAAFYQHLLPGHERYTNYQVVYIPHLAQWDVKVTGGYHIPTGLLETRWGTARTDALALLEMGLNAQIPVVKDAVGKDEDGREKYVVNVAETAAAQQKLEEIKAEFEKWLWSDVARAERLAALYNERYNAFRVRQYDGSHLSTPGLNREITLRRDQRNCVWRILQSRATLVGHVVGMGKTLTGVVAAMESKRLGLTRKAMIVVPNHLTGQWHAQVLLAYPNANVLCVTPPDMEKANRGVFLSRIAVNDWDIVIVPASSFKFLPVDIETEKAFFEAQIAILEDYLWELKGSEGGEKAVKEIQKAKKRLEAKLANLADMPKDARGTIIFEEMGVDMLIADEFHIFKNLFFSSRMTRIAGLPNTQSQRALDMFLKFRWLQQNGGKVVGLTGAPATATLILDTNLTLPRP